MTRWVQDYRDRRGRHRRVRDERGSAGIELLIMAAASVGLVLVVVASGRYVDGQAQANDAAYAAARAASLVPNPSEAVTAGRKAAADALEERGKSCQDLSVTFAGSDFNPGGQVIAEVSCTVNLTDTGAIGSQLGLQPKKEFTQRAVVPIENYRDSSGEFTISEGRNGGN
jgi:Flp pilus assembly protein TadG